MEEIQSQYKITNQKIKDKSDLSGAAGYGGEANLRCKLPMIAVEKRRLVFVFVYWEGF